jgi:di/tricarboxylate transporter
LHHLGVELVGITGVFLFVLPGIGTINFEDFMKKAVPWSQLVFIGSLMSLVVMTSTTDLDKYIGNTLVVPVYSFANNSALFVVSTWLLNTVTGAFSLFVPSIALLTPAIAGAAIAAGLNPVIGTLIYLSCFPQMFFYAAAPFFPLAYDSGAISTWDWVKAGFFYWLIWPITHLVCLYTWYPLLRALGILH